jgi:hypothetical protein
MDENQIEVPASYMALFTTPNGRLAQPMEYVRARYELCEDMAQLISEKAGMLLAHSGGTEGEVLSGLAAALSGSEYDLDPGELPWVMTRMAELLGWEPLDPRLFDGNPDENSGAA